MPSNTPSNEDKGMHSWNELSDDRCPEHGVEWVDVSDAIEDPRDLRCIYCMRDQIDQLAKQLEDEKAYNLEKRKEAAEAIRLARSEAGAPSPSRVAHQWAHAMKLNYTTPEL